MPSPLFRYRPLARAAFGFVCGASALSNAACTEVLGETPTLQFEFGMRVVSDDERPIVGAEIKSPTGTAMTDDDGFVALVARGHEGDRQAHTVLCPSEYQSPASPQMVSIRRVEADKRPVYVMTCVPLRRNVVVGVRVENGPDLPVKYLGQEVARTDKDGAAHALVNVAAGEPFTISLDTSASPDADRITPANPTKELAVAGDDVVMFEQKLTVAPAPVAPRVAVKRKAGPPPPKRI